MPSPQEQQLTIDAYLKDALSAYQTVAQQSGYGPSDAGNTLGHAIENPGNRAEYMPRAGESLEVWAKRVDNTFPGLGAYLTGKVDPYRNGGFDDVFHGGGQARAAADFMRPENLKMLQDKAAAGDERSRKMLEAINKLGGDDRRNTFINSAGFADPNNPGKTIQAGGPPAGPQGPTSQQLLQEFARQMMDPNNLNPNDPYVANVIRSATAATQGDAAARGLSGGYAVSNTQDSATKALAAIQMQRQQIAGQALGQSANIDLGQAQLQQQAYNQQYQATLANMTNQYQAAQANNQSLWGTVGGVGGAVVGGYFGGPQGAMAGAQAGSRLGAGLGGTQGGAPPSLNYNPPALGNGGGGSRGGY